MSQVAKLSGSLLLSMTIILLMGLSLQTGLCQQLNSTPQINDTSIVETPEIPAFLLEDTPDTFNLKDINAFDKQMILSYGNDDMGLISGLTTELIFGDDGTIDKSRKMGIFSWGSELMEINEVSWLYGTGFGDDELFRYGYDNTTILEDTPFPFVVIRDDLMKLSDTKLNLVDSTSNTYLYLYEDFETDYNINALNAAFGNFGDAGAPQIKMFKYDPDLNNMTGYFGFDLSMYFDSDIWAQFGAVFDNDEIMDMFNQLAKDQLAAKNNPPDPNNFPPRNWWEESIDGEYCRWGSVP